jgi:deoxyribodipyrimidine photolyase
MLHNRLFAQSMIKLNGEMMNLILKAWREGKTGYPVVDAGMSRIK